MKKLLPFLLLLVVTSSMLAQKKVTNQEDNFIFDLSKVDFKEDYRLLFPAQEKFKLFLVNDDFEKKEEEELLKKDDIKAFLYSVMRNKTKQNVVYDNFFNFDNIKFITDNNNNIIAYQTYNFYEGSMKDIDNFVIKLQNKLKGNVLKTGKLVNGALVYQYYSETAIVQLERDIRKEKETTYSGGKEIVKYTCHVSLSVYNRKLFNTDLENYLKYKADFLLYDKEHYARK
jgi:hypothetical protein